MRFPPEVLDMVRKEGFMTSLLTDAEAKDHREKLMKERSRYFKESNQMWENNAYNFCEH